ITITIQFVPYFLVKNGPSVLLSAMSALLFQFSWGSVFRTLKDQFSIHQTVAFYIFMWLSTGTMLLIAHFHFREHRSNLTASIFLSGALLCMASILGLEYSSVKSHYFWHYSILYVPYASVIFTYLCIFISRQRLQRSNLMKSGMAMLAGWYFSVMGTQLWEMKGTIFTAELSFSINYRNIDPALMYFLKKVVS